MPGRAARIRVSSVIARVVLRHVEIGANEDPLVGEVEVGHAQYRVHRRIDANRSCARLRFDSAFMNAPKLGTLARS